MSSHLRNDGDELNDVGDVSLDPEQLRRARRTVPLQALGQTNILYKLGIIFFIKHIKGAGWQIKHKHKIFPKSKSRMLHTQGHIVLNSGLGNTISSYMW